MTSTGIRNYYKPSTGWIEPEALSNESETLIYLKPFLSKFFGVPIVPQIGLEGKIWTLLNQESQSPLLKEKKIQLAHITPQTFIQILHFIRRDPYILTKENLDSTWEAAADLQIKRLQDFCLQWVKEQLELLERKDINDQMQEIETWIRWFPILFSEGSKDYCQKFIVQYLNACMEISFELFSKGVNLSKTLPIEEFEVVKRRQWSKNDYELYLKKLSEIGSIKFLKIPFGIDINQLMVLHRFANLTELDLNCSWLKPEELLQFREHKNFSLQKISLCNLSYYFQTQVGHDVIRKLPLKKLIWVNYIESELNSTACKNLQKSEQWKRLGDDSLDVLQGLPLETLKLHNWKNLTSEAYFKFQSFTHLRTLIFESCQINNAALAVLSLCDQLQKLKFSNVPFSNEGLAAIGCMKFLKSLSITFNDHIDLAGLRSLLGLSESLTSLQLDYCKQLQIHPDFLNVLSHLPQLSSLSLMGYLVDPLTFQEFLKGMPKLKHIHLTYRDKHETSLRHLQTIEATISLQPQRIFYRPAFADQPGLYIKGICQKCKNPSKKWTFIGNNDFYNLLKFKSSVKCIACKNASVRIDQWMINQCDFSLFSQDGRVAMDLSQINRVYKISAIDKFKTVWLGNWLSFSFLDLIFAFLPNYKESKKYSIFV